MNCNIDEYKINGNKIYINGWAHSDNYKIRIVSNNEKKEIKKYNSRYDICMLFHEKIEDNNYGFKEEIEFKEKIKVALVYIINKKKEILVLKIDNRKVINSLRKIKKFLGKIKRGMKFLWREYHFLVPPTMIKKYARMVLKKQNDKNFYNPEIVSEYNEWLLNQKYLEECNNKNITFIGNEKLNLDNFQLADKNLINQIKKIKTQYICLVEGNIKIVNGFFAETNKYIEEDYDLIYYDNDEIINGKYENPIFKPDWSPDTLLGVNYIGNCYIIKKELLKKLEIKDFNLYDVLLNLRNHESKVKHIPKILYHDNGKVKNGYKELKEFLKNNKVDAEIIKNTDCVTNTVKYNVKDKPLVSIIIPTKDHADILEQCLKSIYERSTYKNYEIIVIDNNSEEKTTFKLLKKYNRKSNFSYKRIECEFNYSYLNNEAVKISKGEYILLLNNDIEVISKDWLETMIGYASQKNIGTVGAKLLFPDNTIQHAGIIMGKGGLAGHAHYGKSKDYKSLQYELKVPYDYSACTAACLMVSKKKFLEVKGLEEKLKVAFNDVDFNLKLLDKGYNNIFLPNVELFHYESKSRGLDTTPEKQKRFIQEWSLIKDKWNKYIEHDNFYNDNFSKNNDYMLK